MIGCRISGGKPYITNAPWVSMFTLMARTGPEVKRPVTCDAILDDVVPPASAIMSGVAGYDRQRWEGLDRDPIHIAALGMCERLTEMSLRLAMECRQFGQPVRFECSALKLPASEAARRVADRAVQIHGAAG